MSNCSHEPTQKRFFGHEMRFWGCMGNSLHTILLSFTTPKTCARSPPMSQITVIVLCALNMLFLWKDIRISQVVVKGWHLLVVWGDVLPYFRDPPSYKHIPLYYLDRKTAQCFAAPVELGPLSAEMWWVDFSILWTFWHIHNAHLMRKMLSLVYS